MTTKSVLRIATRSSLLARTQTGWVADRIRSVAPDVAIELVEVTSAGDTDRTTPIASMSEVGAFTKALQVVLLAGGADLAVHSLKDLPTIEPDGLAIAAVPVREDPRDALVTSLRCGLAELPQGATVGTGSPRRAQQLAELRPDLCFTEIRGNVDTRLRKAREGGVDATVLAVAGLRRIGRADEIDDILGIVSAPGQGALAVECRADDHVVIAMMAALDDELTRVCVTAERAWLHATGAGCRTSAAAHATIEGGVVNMTWFLDGRRGSASGPVADAEGIGRRAAL